MLETVPGRCPVFLGKALITLASNSTLEARQPLAKTVHRHELLKTLNGGGKAFELVGPKNAPLAARAALILCDDPESFFRFVLIGDDDGTSIHSCPVDVSSLFSRNDRFLLECNESLCVVASAAKAVCWTVSGTQATLLGCVFSTQGTILGLTLRGRSVQVLEESPCPIVVKLWDPQEMRSSAQRLAGATPAGATPATFTTASSVPSCAPSPLHGRTEDNNYHSRYLKAFGESLEAIAGALDFDGTGRCTLSCCATAPRPSLERHSCIGGFVPSLANEVCALAPSHYLIALSKVLYSFSSACDSRPTSESVTWPVVDSVPPATTASEPAPVPATTLVTAAASTPFASGQETCMSAPLKVLLAAPIVQAATATNPAPSCPSFAPESLKETTSEPSTGSSHAAHVQTSTLEGFVTTADLEQLRATVRNTQSGLKSEIVANFIACNKERYGNASVRKAVVEAATNPVTGFLDVVGTDGFVKLVIRQAPSPKAASPPAASTPLQAAAHPQPQAGTGAVTAHDLEQLRLTVKSVPSGLKSQIVENFIACNKERYGSASVRKAVVEAATNPVTGFLDVVGTSGFDKLVFRQAPTPKAALPPAASTPLQAAAHPQPPQGTGAVTANDLEQLRLTVKSVPSGLKSDIVPHFIARNRERYSNVTVRKAVVEAATNPVTGFLDVVGTGLTMKLAFRRASGKPRVEAPDRLGCVAKADLEQLRTAVESVPSRLKCQVVANFIALNKKRYGNVSLRNAVLDVATSPATGFLKVVGTGDSMKLVFRRASEKPRVEAPDPLSCVTKADLEQLRTAVKCVPSRLKCRIVANFIALNTKRYGNVSLRNAVLDVATSPATGFLKVVGTGESMKLAFRHELLQPSPSHLVQSSRVADVQLTSTAVLSFSNSSSVPTLDACSDSTTTARVDLQFDVVPSSAFIDDVVAPLLALPAINAGGQGVEGSSNPTL